MQITKIMCIFYLVSLHISLSVTPTPFIIHKDFTRVWVDDNCESQWWRAKGMHGHSVGKGTWLSSRYVLVLLTGCSSCFVNVVEIVRSVREGGHKIQYTVCKGGQNKFYPNSEDTKMCT